VVERAHARSGSASFPARGLAAAYAGRVPSTLAAILSTAVGLLFFVGGIVWFYVFFTRCDAWIRARVGRFFGVTIELGAKSHWRVREPGARAFLIGMLQPVTFLFALLVWGLWMALGIVLSQQLAGH
jgi:hypothetical protein